MPAYKYNIKVNEDGSLDFHTKLPEIKGKTVTVFILEPFESTAEFSSEEIIMSADKDWKDWLDPEEDIYEEYRKFIPKR